MRRTLRVLAATVLTLASPAVASAHPFSVSYARLLVQPGQVVVTLRLPLDDMDLLLRLDRDLDGQVSPQELDGARTALSDYAAPRLDIRGDDHALAPVLARLARWTDPSGTAYIELEFVAPLNRAPSRVSARITALADLYPDHRTLAEFIWADRREEFVFQHGNTLVVDRGLSSWWTTTQTFLVLGFEHILTGYDHLLFLLGLLVAGRSLRDLVAVVSAFTVAHSLTLAAATLGIVSPPARLIEAAIALSIVYVGVENLASAAPRGRWRIAFAFGLVHGFGFATVLRAMDLPRHSLATSLLTFNLGVELGQIGVVLLAWPVLRLLHRSAYSSLATRLASWIVVTCGVFWFVQRVW